MGLFLTFEGPDGSGKSTQAHLLASELRARGHDVVETREPGGTQVGEAVRHVLLDLNGPEMSPRTMALLLSASRAQLVSDVIVPALESGRTVIADRYTDSTLAYQSYGFGLKTEVVQDLSHIATLGVTPDVTVLVDVPVDVGLERVFRRGAHNRLDAPDTAFHERVREGYHQLAAAEPTRWVTVDGTQDPRSVHRALMHKLAPMLQEVAQPT
jgi:dTMP kinase